MKEEQNYIQDIAEIRSMMERSTRFLSLSGWAGIMAGIYALAGVFIAYQFLGFNPDKLTYGSVATANEPVNMLLVIAVALMVLLLATGTAVVLSQRKAAKRGEKLWSPTSKRLLIHMAVPLATGGLLALALISHGLAGLLAPVTLLFYGLALYNAGKFTLEEIKILGILQILLGLLSMWFVQYALLIWAFGFGLLHIIYGIYIYYRYEK